MSEELIRDLLRALGLAVIERLPNSAYHLLTPAPDWLAAAFEAAPTGAQGTLGGALPFLDHFLHQADAAWHDRRAEPVTSGPFAATVGGEELLLRASAMSLHGRALLVVERLTGEADTRPILQKAREHLLDREQLERQVRQVHAPAAALARGVERLLATSLSAGQQAIATDLEKAAADLQAAMTPLPAPLPKGRRRPS